MKMVIHPKSPVIPEAYLYREYMSVQGPAHVRMKCSHQGQTDYSCDSSSPIKAIRPIP